MSDTIIRVENLGKKYVISHDAKKRANTFRDAVMSGVRSLGQRIQRPLHPVGAGAREEFWALKDVNFEVKRGEVVGIIGRNGAGKSTLLKILSRITEPTTGRVTIDGRVASLLEVGTGFHPELTGRENIYLNGAILGMSRAEITRKFDEIVAFAEVEKFLDTPVKHYSSGMYMRLAFAVAAHLETDILIVDEVLAVGDASFQRKCLGRMEDVGRQGRVVLVVSHNMAAVTRLCTTAMLLHESTVKRQGAVHKVVDSYMDSGLGTIAHREWPEVDHAPGNHVVRLRSVRVRTEEGIVTETFDIRRPIGVEMEFEVLTPGFVLIPGFHFYNDDGLLVFLVVEKDSVWQRRPRPIGRHVTTVWIPGNFLAEGRLSIGAAISTMNPVIVHFWERDVVGFHVVDSMDGDAARGDYAGHFPGVVRPVFRWTTEHTPRDLGSEAVQGVKNGL